MENNAYDTLTVLDCICRSARASRRSLGRGDEGTGGQDLMVTYVLTDAGMGSYVPSRNGSWDFQE